MHVTVFSPSSADFGIAAQLTQTLLMKRKSFIGTPYWMAPEVLSSVIPPPSSPSLPPSLPPSFPPSLPLLHVHIPLSFLTSLSSSLLPHHLFLPPPPFSTFSPSPSSFHPPFLSPSFSPTLPCISSLPPSVPPSLPSLYLLCVHTYLTCYRLQQWRRREVTTTSVISGQSASLLWSWQRHSHLCLISTL